MCVVGGGGGGGRGGRKGVGVKKEKTQKCSPACKNKQLFGMMPNFKKKRKKTKNNYRFRKKD